MSCGFEVGFAGFVFRVMSFILQIPSSSYSLGTVFSPFPSKMVSPFYIYIIICENPCHLWFIIETPSPGTGYSPELSRREPVFNQRTPFSSGFSQNLRLIIYTILRSPEIPHLLSRILYPASFYPKTSPILKLCHSPAPGTIPQTNV